MSAITLAVIGIASIVVTVLCAIRIAANCPQPKPPAQWKLRERTTLHPADFDRLLADLHATDHIPEGWQ